MGPYRVYYMNVYQTTFANRDVALEFIMRDANMMGRSLTDYEILDRSDSL